jgi:hypothetical protein
MKSASLLKTVFLSAVGRLATLAMALTRRSRPVPARAPRFVIFESFKPSLRRLFCRAALQRLPRASEAVRSTGRG